MRNTTTNENTKKINFFINGTLTTLNISSDGELYLGQPNVGYNKISDFNKQLVLSNLNTNTPKEVLDVLFKLKDKDINSKMIQHHHNDLEKLKDYILNNSNISLDDLINTQFIELDEIKKFHYLRICLDIIKTSIERNITLESIYNNWDDNIWFKKSLEIKNLLAPFYSDSELERLTLEELINFIKSNFESK